MNSAGRVVLALTLGLPLHTLAQDAPDQHGWLMSEEVASCRVRQGHSDALGDTISTAGTVTLVACARTIEAGSRNGTWGPYKVDVGTDGQVHVNDEAVGVLRKLRRQDENDQRG